MDRPSLLESTGCRPAGRHPLATGARARPGAIHQDVDGRCGAPRSEGIPRARASAPSSRAATGLRLQTDGDAWIEAQHVIVCAGFESGEFLSREWAGTSTTPLPWSPNRWTMRAVWHALDR
jgi:hypothetical protein